MTKIEKLLRGLADAAKIEYKNEEDSLNEILSYTKFLYIKYESERCLCGQKIENVVYMQVKNEIVKIGTCCLSNITKNNFAKMFLDIKKIDKDNSKKIDLTSYNLDDPSFKKLIDEYNKIEKDDIFKIIKSNKKLLSFIYNKEIEELNTNEEFINFFKENNNIKYANAYIKVLKKLSSLEKYYLCYELNNIFDVENEENKEIKEKYNYLFKKYDFRTRKYYCEEYKNYKYYYKEAGIPTKFEDRNKIIENCLKMNLIENSNYKYNLEYEFEDFFDFNFEKNYKVYYHTPSSYFANKRIQEISTFLKNNE